MVKIFDSKESDRGYSEFGIKTFFGEISNDYLQKVIYINHFSEVNIQKSVQANIEWIKSYKVDFSTMKQSAWI